VRTNNYLTTLQITQRCAFAAVFGLVLAVIANAQSTSVKTLKLVVLSPEIGDSQYYSSGDAPPPGALARFEKGIQLGIEEADRTGRLLGWTVSRASGSAPDSAILSSGVREPVVVAFMETPQLSTAIRDFGRRRGLLLSAFGSNKALKCSARIFRITGASSKGAALWDSTDERFGAAQLNDRYRSRFHEGMDSNAWAGWLAVKVLSEAAFRTGSSKTDAILRYLLSPETKFDGHKGRQLQFAKNHIMNADSTNSNAVAQCK
jgi:hypothetical protein